MFDLYRVQQSEGPMAYLMCLQEHRDRLFGVLPGGS
jgi:hypothetical protein